MRPDSELAGERNAWNIAGFLAAFPNLEELELQWFSLHTFEPSEGHVAEQNFLRRFNDTVRWSRLRACNLKGLHTTDELLLTFFNRHLKLTSATLEGLGIPCHKKW